MEFSEVDRLEYRDRFYRTVALLDDDSREIMRRHKVSAQSYVWGWQDGRQDEPTDSLAAEIYGYAYGTVRALYTLGRVSVASSVSWGWVKFRETGHITELYEGQMLALDLVPLTGERSNV